jgi:His-Xaa-Ser system radical SAM maturase HxsB
MDFETAERAVDVALSCPSDSISFEFQGGEPLINFESIKHIIEYANQKNSGKHIDYNIVSNLTLLTDEIAEYLTSHSVRISVSLDGDEELHDINRKYRSGCGTYNDVLKGIKLIKRYGASPGAIQTTTRYSLDKYKEIIDKYIELGFSGIFLRPLTPLGFANESWDEIGYSEDEFMDFYKKSLRYILEQNKKGVFFSEGHARMMLNKILNGESVNYMELRSPCGAGLGQMAFYYDGNVYTCDEGRMLSEMGNNIFKMGNVYQNSYDELLESSACKALSSSSFLESLPICSDCVYNPCCGVCPVINFALERDLISRKYRSLRCGFYKGILDSLFDILYNEKSDDYVILRNWVDCVEE